jgi:hypothetical protein
MPAELKSYSPKILFHAELSVFLNECVRVVYVFVVTVLFWYGTHPLRVVL